MKNNSKTKGGRPTQNNSNNNDRQREMSLEKTLKKMKQVIAGLTILVIIGIVWIATLMLSNPSQDKLDRNASSVVNAIETNPAQEQTQSIYDMPAGSQQSNPSANTTSNTGENAVATTPENTPKLNPPHGQPGHRCEIAVGAPLN